MQRSAGGDSREDSRCRWLAQIGILFHRIPPVDIGTDWPLHLPPMVAVLLEDCPKVRYEYVHGTSLVLQTPGPSGSRGTPTRDPKVPEDPFHPSSLFVAPNHERGHELGARSRVSHGAHG